MRIAGVDEVGVGPLAGPVVAVAALYDDLTCPFPELLEYEDGKFAGYKDSKKLTAGLREKLFESFIDAAIDVGLGVSLPEEIDREGIAVAHRWTLRRAIKDLEVEPELVYLDGEKFKLRRLGIPQRARNKADQTYWQVACASVIAKVWRDRLMQEYAAQYPGYSLETNAGYPTQAHIRAIGELGLTPIHRTRYAGKFSKEGAPYRSKRANRL